MSRSTTASRALAILLLGASLSTSGVLAAPTSMDPTQMSSDPSSNGARDLQFQSADGQAHSLSDEGLELELPRTVQVHRGGVEHPNVVLRRDGDRLSFADSGYLDDKDGMDRSIASVSAGLERRHDTQGSLADQAAQVKNAEGAIKLGKKLIQNYYKINDQWVGAENRRSSKSDMRYQVYGRYDRTVKQMVDAAKKAASFSDRALAPLSVSEYETLASKFKKYGEAHSYWEKLTGYEKPLGLLLNEYNRIYYMKDKEERQSSIRGLATTENIETVKRIIADAKEAKAHELPYDMPDSNESSLAEVILHKSEPLLAALKKVAASSEKKRQ